MNKRLSFLLIFLFFPLIIVRAEEIALTTEEAVGIALRDNRDILLKAAEVKKAKAKIAEANAGLLPSLSFTGSWKDIREFYAKDLPQIDTQTTLKQYLYKGGKIINTIQYNKYGMTVAEAVLDKAKIEIVLGVKKAFYTLLLADEFVKINKGILDNTFEHLEFLKARYQNGQASESDIIKINASLETVRQAYVASLNQAEAAQALLANLLYLDKDIKIKPQAQFNYVPEELAFDEAFLKAMKARPEIRQYEAQEKANKKSIEIAKADTRPSIYASWDYYSSSTQILTFAPQRAWQDYNTIGITFSWPIFDGWATKAKVEQAIVDLKETQLTKEKTIKDIALEIKNAYLNLKTAIATMKATQADIDLYQDTLSVTKDKYNSGIASLLDMHDVSLGYEVAAFNYKQAVYDYIIAKASFDKATGGV
jgi:outer membrane protein TolC